MVKIFGFMVIVLSYHLCFAYVAVSIYFFHELFAIGISV